MLSAKDLIHFFRISRPINVLITWGAFSLSCFLISRPSLDFFQLPGFWAALAALGVVTGTGYWINDVYDFKIDRVNKPRKTIVNAHLSRKKVLTAYFLALFCGMVASFFSQPLTLFALNGGVIFALFAYAAWLKRTTVIGNLLIAAMTATVIYYSALVLGHLSPIVGWACMFAFGITFLREVTKDIEDIRGDLRFRLETLPIRVGIRAAKNILAYCYGLFILTCWVPFAFEKLALDYWNWEYAISSLGLVQAPCIYLLAHLKKAAKTKDFAHESLILKLMIFPGLATLFFLH